MGEVGSRALAQKEGADPEEVDPGEATHPWIASVYLSWDQQEEPRTWSGLQGPWLELRDPRESLRPEAPESLSGQLIRLVVLPDEGRPSTSTCQLVASPSWRCSRRRC